jgi:hypothetical protein
MGAQMTSSVIYNQFDPEIREARYGGHAGALDFEPLLWNERAETWTLPLLAGHYRGGQHDCQSGVT